MVGKVLFFMFSTSAKFLVVIICQSLVENSAHSPSEARGRVQLYCTSHGGRRHEDGKLSETGA